MPDNQVKTAFHRDYTGFMRLILCLLLVISSHSLAAPSADLWQRWVTHNTESTRSISHDPWQKILSRYVTTASDGINRFDYQAVSNDDKKQLDSYLASLAATSISQYHRDQQLAFWINLYNALTVQVILDNFPLDSIRDISSGLFSSGPWSLELITIEDEALTLDDIEHRILRPIWQDARIHYAVNCASLGCPNLQNRAFTAENSETLLDRAAREFINHPRGVKIDDHGELIVSSIYDWFEDDFGGEAGVISHISQYAEQSLATILATIDEVEDYHYDWTLNSPGKKH